MSHRRHHRHSLAVLGFTGLLGLLGAGTSGCGHPTGTLAQGSKAPQLTAVAHDGTTIDLAKLGQPTVVYFYPKDGTPGCTKEACAFRDVWARYEKAGVLVVGVSADDPDSHREFAAEHRLPFPLVSDE